MVATRPGTLGTYVSPFMTDDGEDSEDVYVSIYDWKESGPDASKGEAW